MLGLADYIHLSPQFHTPLLADKLRRGYAHSLLVFHAAPVLAQPETALLAWNPKSWRKRAALQPVTDPDECAALWHRHLATGRFPSLEVLVKYGLSLEHLQRIVFFCAEEYALVAELAEALALPRTAPWTVEPELFASCAAYTPTTRTQIAAYFAACRAAGELLPPPAIPFD
jgi:hypothetical protein